ncbi:hypothetical protein CAOG_07484 [Capsaspora owczarzaki ATCC 30864]|uniref:C-CAP/cofactor C-like domain-containing protein n=1 Tax=Capsaspora owczarzaki (strain ATCC 30864) TaxID=595528 RepID=A0A0D2WVT6_CAPO3|nr:hypothetical protein CAOG_07484 [Capsaspora owczarzaki ATCC 30864]KJE96995.1 hypothetical protein CAOG_007484 [Capsaspora owczarzaki ATCC 30864]|eukprot:XP_004343358.1 hypothetical protein CAOG_07484 [Capsaspora owczarzaki ATCC 30864]
MESIPISSTSQSEPTPLPDWLSQRALALKTASAEKKQERDAEAASTLATPAAFWAAFDARRAEFDGLITGGTIDQVAADQRIAELQQIVSDATLFLPAFDLRSAQQQIVNLQERCQAAMAANAPKKKFAFKAKPAATGAPKAASVAAPSIPVPDANRPTSHVEHPAVPKPVEKIGASEGCTLEVLSGNAARALSDISNRHVLVQQADGEESTTSSGSDSTICISNVTNSTVEMALTGSSARLLNVRSSRILLGPVSGSVFLENCVNCEVYLTAQQFRGHHCHWTRVVCHLTAKGIIEDCTTMQFGRLRVAPASEPLYQALFKASRLDASKPNHSHQIDDFMWLHAATPSPNWTPIDDDHCEPLCFSTPPV